MDPTTIPLSQSSRSVGQRRRRRIGGSMRLTRRHVAITTLCCLVTLRAADAWLHVTPLSFAARRRRSLSTTLAAASRADATSETVGVRRFRNSNKNNSNHNHNNQPPPNRRQSSSEAPHNNNNLERTIVKLGRQGKTEKALELFYDIPAPTIRQFNAALDVCGRARPVRLDQAFALYHSIQTTVGQQLHPNVYTFGALINVCARARNASRALHVLQQEMPAAGVTPNAVVVSACITACARANPPQVQQAMDLILSCEVPLTVTAYNAALFAAARAGQANAAVDLLERMLTSSDDNDKIRPDAVTYGTVLSACETAGRWPQVLEYARSMQEAGWALDGMAYTSVLHACQQLGQYQQALQCLQDMQRETVADHVRASSQTRRRAPLQGPDAVCFRLVISACARGGAWKEGIQVLEDYVADSNVPNAKQDVMAYTAAIVGCEHAGEYKVAFTLLDKLRQAGGTPNAVTYCAVISACAVACAKESKTEGGNQASGSSSGLVMPPPQKYALQLLNALLKENDTETANVAVFNAAIRVCAEALDVKRAFRLYDLMTTKYEVQPNFITFGSLMTACERVGTMEGVSQVFRLLRETETEPNEIMYGAALSACRKAKQPERALALLKRMIKAGLKPNVATCNTVLTALAEGPFGPADQQGALLIYRLLLSASDRPQEEDSDSESDDDSTTTIQRTRYTLDGPNRQTFCILIRALANHKEPRQAEALIRQMRNSMVPDVDLYTATVRSYERAGQPLQALRLLDSMRADGYDFYEVPVLNAAFKKAIRLVNGVGGRKWRDVHEEEERTPGRNAQRVQEEPSLWNEQDDEDLLD